MKRKVQLISFIFVIWAFWGEVFCAQYSPMLHIDLTKTSDEYSTFVANALWPSAEEIERGRISTSDVRADVEEFKKMLGTVLRQDFVAGAEIIESGLIASERLRRNDDYLLLQYNKNGFGLQIQDGKALYILALPESGEEAGDLDNVEEYVRGIASAVLNIPEYDEKGKEPVVFVSKKDVGESKLGTISYESSFPPPRFWYSHVRWWSDGRAVLFEIGKAAFHGIDLEKAASAPERYKVPRKFRK